MNPISHHLLICFIEVLRHLHAGSRPVVPRTAAIWAVRSTSEHHDSKLHLLSTRSENENEVVEAENR